MIQMHKDMQRMSIYDLYGVINRARRENTIGADIIAQWAEYYIDLKFKGQYS